MDYGECGEEIKIFRIKVFQAYAKSIIDRQSNGILLEMAEAQRI